MRNRYPRPQMKRKSFQSLDGPWIINGDPGIVPSCRTEENLFYEKTFDFHRENRRALLHIDAADQVAEVFLNGLPLGIHEGGYLPFSFDISDVVQEGSNKLEIRVVDTLDHKYPYGKQAKKPSGMWYTPVSGIWKSVWIEQVPEEYIVSVRITPDLRGADVDILSSTGVHTARRFEPESPVPWTPENPVLYWETIRLGEDCVEIYYALRTIEKKYINGIERVCLNGEPVFLNGVLDQGYWQPSLFIPKEADGYEKDILRMKDLGFNMLRKHIKIEDEEFYYQCDRLGMLVIQDMVQTGDYHFIKDSVLPTIGVKFGDRVSTLSEAQKFFLLHSEATVAFLYSHPCIIAWTVFNEGWGQFNSDELFHLFKSWDTTRLVDSASGWFVQKESDFDSPHIYFRLADLKPGKRPLLVSECGGYSLAVNNAKVKWGYGRCRSEEELTERILALYEKMILPKIKDGVCGIVYTQLSDVEGELNGLYTADRKCKVNRERLSAKMSTLQEYLPRLKYCAPGRIEICGNHTDHQHGCVLTASVDQFCQATVERICSNEVQIESEGFAPFSVSLQDLEYNPEEKGSSKSLVKGILKKFSEKGSIPGFHATICSAIRPGSGLSSSAAFEVLICRIVNSLGAFHISNEEIAKISQYAENEYYGKPCGLMDQMASSCTGMLFLDFADSEAPTVEQIDFDFEQYGYDVFVVNSHIDHSDLTEEYAAIPREIGEVCSYFGKNYLREVDEAEFQSRLPELQRRFSSRSLQRCIHVFEENRRVQRAVEAAKHGDVNTILDMINQSGDSSENKLQNITPEGTETTEGLAAVLCICKEALHGEGAVRVHGGGFAGTVLCIVPKERRETFIAEINRSLGESSAVCVHISWKEGAYPC